MAPTLRVCALYPDLMNIYADRGNIAVLRARCEWRDLGRSLDAAVADRDGGRPLYALPTYTALLELRDLLADRGVARRWSD